MTRKALARKILRDWCKQWGLAIEPMCGADLVSRIALELEQRGQP